MITMADGLGLPGIPADLFDTIVRHAHVAVAVGSLPDHVLIEANDAFFHLFDVSREAAIGRRSNEYGIWPDPAQRDRMMALVERHGQVTGHELRYRNSRGEEGWLRATLTRVHHEGADYLVSFFTEVTTEHELLQGLQDTRARLDLALRSTGLLVFRQDHDLRYTWVANPALGATEADLIGRNDDEIMGAEAAAPLVAIKRRVLQTGRAERRDVWVANGHQLGCFDLTVEPERDAAGRVVAIVCAAQDITQRKTAQSSTAEPASHRTLLPLLQAVQGMSSLIGREHLSDWQLSRLRRITDEARQLTQELGATPTLWAQETAPAVASPGWARQRLRERHRQTLVLVAEENAVLREMTAASLEDAGLRVARAVSGVEAFSLCVQLTPALLLLDMQMPQRGGVAAARAVRTMMPERVPIIAMVSADPPGGMAPVLDADVDDVIDKPAAGDRLYEKVLTWLQA